MRTKTIIAASLLGTTLPASAFAQCALPEDATVIVCTGADEDGIVIDDERVVGLDVREGAVLRSDDTAVLFVRGDPEEPFALTQIDGRVEAGVLGIEFSGVPTNRTSLVISETGSVDSDGSAVEVGTTLESVVNDGTITARDGFGVSLGGFDDFAVLNPQSFVNRGSVTATGAALAANFNTTIFNRGTLVSTGPGGAGASVGDVADVSNSGTIRGAIGVVGGDTVFLRNDGVIEGTEVDEPGVAPPTGPVAVRLGDGGDTIEVGVNGVFVGDVLTEGGRDTLDLVALSVGSDGGNLGRVTFDLGEGTDTVVLGEGAEGFASTDVMGVAVVSDSLAEIELALRQADGGALTLRLARAELFAFRDGTLTLDQLGEVPLPGAALFVLTGLGLGARLRRR